LHQLVGFPPQAINCYLLDSVLVDAATRHSARRIARDLRGQPVALHVLTHAHPDHQGATAELCEAAGLRLMCGAGDVEAMESGRFEHGDPHHPAPVLFEMLFAGPPRHVDGVLKEGDRVGSFTVLETPGHTPGHLAFWRERDRALVLGDVLANMDTYTGMPGLRDSKRVLSVDPALNRRSARRLAELRPRLVCFGHGAPLRDEGRFVDFVARLTD
jgi:glyoxylase-like metal-dependent hydrolase (beta-lactamase superfamily II)